jgi:hypothetical protein
MLLLGSGSDGMTVDGSRADGVVAPASICLIVLDGMVRLTLRIAVRTLGTYSRLAQLDKSGSLLVPTG